MMDLLLFISAMLTASALLFLMQKLALVGIIGAMYSAILGISAYTSGITQTFCGSTGTSLLCVNQSIDPTAGALSFSMLFLVFITYTIVKLSKGGE